MPGSEIETYPQQIGSEFRLAEGNSNRNLIGLRRLKQEIWLPEGDSNRKAIKNGCEIDNRKRVCGWMNMTMLRQQLKTSHNNMKTFKSCSPYFEVSSEKGSQTRHKAVKTKPVNKHVLELKQRMGKLISKFVSALFLLVSFCFSLLFLSFQQLLIV